MPSVVLRLRAPIRVPLDLGVISPNEFSGRSVSEIEELQVMRGNRTVALTQLFDVSGEAGTTAAETHIVIQGDLPTARRIGREMDSGSITVDGAVGMYLGERMRGGKIVVHGCADSWAGVDMRGGTMEIFGDVGDCLGSAYRGTRTGLRSGAIIVHGNAGAEAGSWVTGGLIKVEGSVGPFAGLRMGGGNLLVKGNADERLGACMTGGKVAVLGHVPSILPSFQIDDVKSKTTIGGEEVEGPFYCFVGDLAEGGEGRLYISVERNPGLKNQEQYIPTAGVDET